MWKTTAVFITVDEGGGYWDSGYVQPLDFFGDGTRIPLIVVSPYSTGPRQAQLYGPCVDPEIHREELGPAHDFKRSRDNLPNPAAGQR